MNLENFKKYIKTVSKTELDSIFDELTSKLKKSRSPAYRLGYALMLDELAIESQMRTPHEPCTLTDEELLNELGL